MNTILNLLTNIYFNKKRHLSFLGYFLSQSDPIMEKRILLIEDSRPIVEYHISLLDVCCIASLIDHMV